MGCFVRSGSRLLRASPQRMKKTGKSHPEDLGKKLVFHCSRAPRARREGTVWSNSPPANQSIFFFPPFITFVRFFPRHPGRPAIKAGSSHPILLLLWCAQRTEGATTTLLPLATTALAACLVGEGAVTRLPLFPMPSAESSAPARSQNSRAMRSSQPAHQRHNPTRLPNNFCLLLRARTRGPHANADCGFHPSYSSSEGRTRRPTLQGTSFS